MRINWTETAKRYTEAAASPGANKFHRRVLLDMAARVEAEVARRAGGARAKTPLSPRARSFAERLLLEVNEREEASRSAPKDADGNILVDPDAHPWKPPTLVGGLWPALVRAYGSAKANRDKAAEAAAEQLASAVIEGEDLVGLLEYYKQTSQLSLAELESLLKLEGKLARALDKGRLTVKPAGRKLVSMIPGRWIVAREGQWSTSGAFPSRPITLERPADKARLLWWTGGAVPRKGTEVLVISAVVVKIPHDDRRVVSGRSYPEATSVRRLRWVVPV